MAASRHLRCKKLWLWRRNIVRSPQTLELVSLSLIVVFCVLFLAPITSMLRLTQRVKPGTSTWWSVDDATVRLSRESKNRGYDSQCGCRKITSTSPRHTEESFCSDSATARGPGQKVLAFCLYGPFEPYGDYVRLNLRDVRRFYPGFTARIYHNYTRGSADREGLCRTFCSNGDLDICDARSLGPMGDVSVDFHVWRFTPILDPLVEEWHSRDLDTRITEREVAAVKDWRDNSSAVFHVMRDHPFHNWLIMAGMWGARMPPADADPSVARLRAGVKRALRRMRHPTLDRDFRWLDQVTLWENMWPVMRDSGSILAHDAYYCRRYDAWAPGVEVRPFPTRRRVEYTSRDGLQIFNAVGYKDGVKLNNFTCPKVCRPEDHKDWKYC